MGRLISGMQPVQRLISGVRLEASRPDLRWQGRIRMLEYCSVKKPFLHTKKETTTGTLMRDVTSARSYCTKGKREGGSYSHLYKRSNRGSNSHRCTWREGDPHIYAHM